MEGQRKINLIVADDHSLFRKGIVSLLEDYDDFSLIREAGNGQELLELVEVEKPDVVLLDLKMPVLSGLSALPILLSMHPWVKVLVLTMHSEPSVIASLIKEGAHGYLLKDTAIEEVIEAIRTVVFTNRNYENKLVTDVLLENSRNRIVSNQLVGLGIGLNKHEEQLLKLIVQQYTNAEIALEMSLGKRTIETYRRILMKKLGVKNTAGLVAFAIEHNLVIK